MFGSQLRFALKYITYNILYILHIIVLHIIAYYIYKYITYNSSNIVTAICVLQYTYTILRIFA